MTRFARSKGSKACNAKAPEDGTPWEVMREQLLQAKKDSEEAKKRQEAENQRIENYENFLKERKVQKRNATWCDFPETEQGKKHENTVQYGVSNIKKKKKNKQQSTEDEPATADIGQAIQNDSKSNVVSDGKKKNKSKNKVNRVIEVETSLAEPSLIAPELSEQVPEEQQSKKKMRKKNKQISQTSVEHGSVAEENNSVLDIGPNSKLNVALENKNKKKKNKNKSKNKVNRVIKVEKRLAEPSLIVPEHSQQVPEEQQSKKKMKKKNKQISQTSVEDGSVAEENNSVLDSGPNSQVNVALGNKNKKKKNKNKNKSIPTENENSFNTCETPGNINNNNQSSNANKQNKIKALIKKKNKALADGKPVRRKEITERSFQLIINGNEVELVRFDGFPIMKKDAERLGELRQSMLQKGIPKSEVQRTMKLERRRAEKALARMKRDVCYNCRKGGHNLSDCPELKSKIPGVDAAEGVCFKCGSTEHRQFECKVQRDKEFRFATCFICKEPGHIARQCPDNPKGLYPNGGCCKLCGDVTHLRKDCPTINEKKEESSVKLQTLDATENIEDIGQQTKIKFTEEIKKPKKIKF